MTYKERLLSGTTVEELIAEINAAADEVAKEKEAKVKDKEIAETRTVLINTLLDYGVKIGLIEEDDITDEIVDELEDALIDAEAELLKASKELKKLKSFANGFKPITGTKANNTNDDAIIKAFLESLK